MIPCGKRLGAAPFHHVACGKNVGTKLFNSSRKALPQSPTSGFFISMPARSMVKPDQSPQYRTFNRAVRRNDTSTANKAINPAIIGFRLSSGNTPKTKLPQVSSNGMLLAFDPVNNADG